jgi:hypothetical protein
MGEGQRIEGQMYRASGLYWGMAIVLLLIVCGGVLVFGYFIKWWAGAAGNWAAAMGGGGAAGGVAVTPALTAVPSSSVPWPVAAGAGFREHWEGRVAGVTTLFAGYWRPARSGGWEHVWSTGVIMPIEGENELVLVVQVPRDQTPDAASEGMLWVCPVELNAAGDYVPVFMDVRLMGVLEGAWVRRMWESGLPSGMAADLVKRTRAAGGRVGGRGWQWINADLSSYFAEGAGHAVEGDDEDEDASR